MALTLKVDHPDFPEGMEFGITGLGVFKNGEEREITEEQERAYISFAQSAPQEQLKQSAFLTVSGSPYVSNVDEVIGKEVSSLPSRDPSAMNIDPTTGEVFEHANLNGISTDPEVIPLEEEEEAVVAPKTIDMPGENATVSNAGGDN